MRGDGLTPTTFLHPALEILVQTSPLLGEVLSWTLHSSFNSVSRRPFKGVPVGSPLWGEEPEVTQLEVAEPGLGTRSSACPGPPLLSRLWGRETEPRPTAALTWLSAFGIFQHLEKQMAAWSVLTPPRDPEHEHSCKTRGYRVCDFPGKPICRVLRVDFALR